MTDATHPPTAPVDPRVKSEPVAREFFDKKAMNSRLKIDSAEKLWEWVEKESARRAASLVSSGSAPSSATKKKRLSALPVGPKVVYRGQADAKYALNSSLYRLVKDSVKREVWESDMFKAEKAIIDSMRGEGLGRLMSSLELLAVLQHHGVPTRLIDFSETLHEALFFAVDRNDAAPGRLFVVQIYDDGREINDDGGKDLPWSGAARGDTRSSSWWTSTVAAVPVSDLDPRMRAQRGTFLAGGLNKRYEGRSMMIGRKGISAEEFPDVTSLGVNFIGQFREEASSGFWGARGWNLRVEAAWKPALRGYLANMPEPITADTMYPPLTEVKRLAKVMAEQALRS